ncbi:MAG: hypothetical protein J1D77_00880 [Muribaculaceae bacterium]|nr:hypothetical protein [Muribaculaceae bacterium]
MAKIRPTTAASMGTKAASGNDSVWTKIALGCDVVGMTDIPVVSQGAEAISGVISLCQGDFISAALSVGSMVPGLGKTAELAKVGRRSVKVADGVATVGKEAKAMEKVVKNSDEVAKAVSQGNKVEKAAAKAPSPQPTKTNAKNVKETPKKETMNDRVNDKDFNIFNSDGTINKSVKINENPSGSIFGGGQGQTVQSFKGKGVNPATQGRNLTNSNPAVNNKFNMRMGVTNLGTLW